MPNGANTMDEAQILLPTKDDILTQLLGEQKLKAIAGKAAYNKGVKGDSGQSYPVKAEHPLPYQSHISNKSGITPTSAQQQTLVKNTLDSF
jgi:hypothetical protein